ncbi:MAG: hypothetical protein GY816_22090 [Cytophagales bacterium]|nr:hypothetical protein [Cytophagales bacterium]
MIYKWSKISLFFLFVVALIGTSLRATILIDLPFHHHNLVHAHSHTAFQGWIYTLLLLLTTSLFINEKDIQKGHYPLQFKLSIFVIIGVLISFSIQGYALYSILFSSLFQLLNYWFIFSFLKDAKNVKNEVKDPISLRFVKTGLWLGVLSTIAPWGIGILSAKGLNGTEIYQSFVYSFLHFQYNGWFLFVAIGLLFKCLENDHILYDQKQAQKFYWCFTIAVVPALSLSLLGMSFREFMILPAYFAASLQILGLVYFFLILRTTLLKWLHQKHRWFQLFLMAFFVSFFVKVLLQFLSVFPTFGVYAFDSKNVVLAYLHLSLIGVISFLLLAILIDLKWLSINWLTRIGSALLLLGFIVTELILFLSGLGLIYNHGLLFIGSLAMAMGILLLLLSPQKLIDPNGKF